MSGDDGQLGARVSQAPNRLAQGGDGKKALAGTGIGKPHSHGHPGANWACCLGRQPLAARPVR